MAEKVVSPGVFTNEIDQSFLRAVVVGPTVKGPALIPTVITNMSEFQQKFGTTFETGSTSDLTQEFTYLTSVTAQNYLKHQGKITVVRVLGDGYSHATGVISASVDPHVIGTGPSGSKGAAGVFDFSSGSVTFGTLLGENGSEVSFSVGFGASSCEFVFTGSAYNAGANNSATQIFIPSGTFDSSDLFIDTFNNSSSLHGLPFTAVSESATKATLTATVPIDPSTTPTLSDAEAGGTNRSGSLFFTGTDAKLTFNHFSEIRPIHTTPKVSFRLHTLTHGNITSNKGTIGVNSKLVEGTKDNVRWEIPSINTKKGTFTLLIRAGNDTIKRKQVLETWNNVTLDPNANNYIGKMIGDQVYTLRKDDSGMAYLQPSGSYPIKSKYVRVEVVSDTVNYLDENGEIREGAASMSLPHSSGSGYSGSNAGAFDSGTDGQMDANPADGMYELISNTNTQGFNLGDSTTKAQYTDILNLLSNSDEYDFNLLLLPGIIDNFSNHSAVVTKAIDVCENRGDAFVVIDPIGWGSNLSTAKTQAETRDSNYSAMYWPWVQMFEGQLGKNVWVPASAAVAGVYAFNDKVAHPWFAPAGLNRGTITTAVMAERKLTHGNRDDLYESNVNPIATFPGQGVCIWGQKTNQKKASALDRVNVRRLMIKVKKFIAASSRFLVFEQNTASTRKRFLNIANPFLEQVQANSGVTAFKVIMDESNNPPDLVDRNILYGQIFVQPTRTAEFIILDFTVQPTGATFPE
jgi:hypothetical protein